MHVLQGFTLTQHGFPYRKPAFQNDGYLTAIHSFQKKSASYRVEFIRKNYHSALLPQVFYHFVIFNAENDRAITNKPPADDHICPAMFLKPTIKLSTMKEMPTGRHDWP
jgi:hypothetical protein